MSVRANNTTIIFNDATTQNTAAVVSANSAAATGSAFISAHPTGTRWQLNTAIFITGGLYGVASDTCQAIFPSSDGTKFFTIGQTSDRVKEHALSTAWVINSATHTASHNVSVSAQETAPTGLFFNNTGDRMYVVGTTSDRVWQYELSVAWQVNSATHTAGANVSVSAQDATPQSICFNNTGSKMYMSGNTSKKIFEYDLSTAWQVNSAVHTSTANLTIASISILSGAVFSANGHKLYVVGVTSTLPWMKQYDCSTAYRINNATLETTYDAKPLLTTGSSPGFGVGFNGFCFRPDGNTMYAVSANTAMEYDMDPQTLRIKSFATQYITPSVNATHIVLTY